jgi:hypothetical protein
VPSSTASLATSAVQADPAASEKSVRVRVRVTPAAAELTLDGKRLASNPFSGTLPLDSSDHVLAASAPGYVGVTHNIRLDSDLDVDLTLQPAAPRGTTGTPAVNKPPGVQPPTRRPLRPVDDKDPYAQ